MGKNLIIRKPTIEEFNKWFNESCIRQAEDRAFSNNSSVKTELENLKEMVKVILPEGKNTKSHYFYVLDNVKTGNIGFIWFGRIPGIEDDETLLFDIMIHKSERGRGYGRYLLSETQKKLKPKGYNRLILSVMDRNPAKHLYKSLGYKAVKINKDHQIMALDI